MNEFDKLLKELDNDLKKFFSSGKKTADTINKIYDVGKRHGIPKELIRHKIELVVNGRIKGRQLRKLLPADLKRAYTKSILPELTHNPVILVDGKLEDPDNAIPAPPPILDKKTLKEREKLPEVIACEIVKGHFEVIAQDLINYPIAKDDPLREELVQAFEEHHGFLMNPKDKKYKHLRTKMKDFYESEEYKQLNTSTRIMNPDGTPIFKEIIKEQAESLGLVITTQYEYTILNFFLSRLFLAITKYYRKYVQPWVEKRAMDVNEKLKLK